MLVRVARDEVLNVYFALWDVCEGRVFSSELDALY